MNPAAFVAVTVVFNTTAATPEVGTPPRPVTCNPTVPHAGTGPRYPVPSRESNTRAGDNDTNAPASVATAATARSGRTTTPATASTAATSSPNQRRTQPRLPTNTEPEPATETPRHRPPNSGPAANTSHARRSSARGVQFPHHGTCRSRSRGPGRVGETCPPDACTRRLSVVIGVKGETRNDYTDVRTVGLPPKDGRESVKAVRRRTEEVVLPPSDLPCRIEG